MYRVTSSPFAHDPDSQVGDFDTLCQACKAMVNGFNRRLWRKARWGWELMGGV